LESRLRARKTESEGRIELRIKKAAWELTQATQFDCCILNDQLEQAVEEAVTRVKSFIEQ